MKLSPHGTMELGSRPRPNGAPLHEVYWTTFEGRFANTPEMLAEAHRLRYQVYCVEHSFLDPANNPGGLERDEYDAHSKQALLLHRRTGATVGTIRLVLHNPGAIHGSLPFHDVCAHARSVDPSVLPLETTAELSRFAISRAFRRRVGDGSYGEGYDRDELLSDGRRIIPHITLGLMTMALRLGVAHGVTHICAVMDPALLRLLMRFGIQFELLGPPVDYHGWRQPCYAELGKFFATIEAERREVWDVVTDCGRLWKSRLHAPSKPRRDVVQLLERHH